MKRTRTKQASGPCCWPCPFGLGKRYRFDAWLAMSAKAISGRQRYANTADRGLSGLFAQLRKV